MADHTEYMPDATRNLETIPDVIDDLVLPTPDGGEVSCRRMPAMNSAHMVLDPPHEEIPVVVVAMFDPYEGGFVAMSPRDARLFAAAVIRSAEAAEAGYGRRPQ